MYYLLNTAMMPQPGNYELIEIDRETFAEEVSMAAVSGDLKHYIGYASTLTLVEQLTGLDLGGTNREQLTALAHGDQLLIIKLNFRPTSEQKQLDDPNIEDFRFFNAIYRTRED